MRLAALVGSADLARLADRFPGLDLDAVVVRTLPRPVRTAAPLVRAIAVGRTIWIDDPSKQDGLLALLAHELTHVVQWRRHGPIGFFTRYLSDYLHARLRGLSHAAAYRQIPAEEEARKTARSFTPD